MTFLDEFKPPKPGNECKREFLVSFIILFLFFEPFRPNLTSKQAKRGYRTHIFLAKFDMGILKTLNSLPSSNSLRKMEKVLRVKNFIFLSLFC